MKASLKMGITPSVDLSYQTQICVDYFAIQMGHTDRFRLIIAPQEVITATRSILSSLLPIDDEYTSPGFIEFKLKGRPWYTLGEKNLNTKYFMCSLLQEYYRIGWSLKTALDLERSGSDSDVLIFQKSQPSMTSVICLSLNSTDRIRVLAPENVYGLIRQIIIQSWPNGIQDEGVFDKSYEFKLKGNPWMAWSENSSDSINSPALICQIMSSLFKNQWKFISAIDTGKNQTSLNALYFYYETEKVDHNELMNTSFFALSLNKSDRIRVHSATNELISLFSNESYGVPNLWKAGIQKTTLINSSTLEFKLKGNPWLNYGAEAVESKKFLNNILNLLSRSGFRLYGVCDLTKHVSNKSTFIFRSKPVEPRTFFNFCVSLNEYDKIRIIDSDPSIVDQVRLAVQQGWPKGIQKESDYKGSFQLKLNGYPFQCLGEDKIHACVLMMLVLKYIEQKGFKFLCNADVSGKYHTDSESHQSYSVDLDACFFEN